MTLADAFPATRPAIPIKGWSDLATDIERAEIHGRVVKDFAPLLKQMSTHVSFLDFAQRLVSEAELRAAISAVLFRTT